ncbi:MAG: DEAD/DEAH box helicase [Acidobacteriaceae bacterium]|nr:DEAD/DEAH box helicase [Acidobacteriaceae bacterium]
MAKRRRPIRALILTPTRELAAQVQENLRDYGKYLPLSSTVIFGGVGMGNQLHALRRGVDIVVATPGRLIDHMQQRSVNLSKVDVLVLDEADRMLDMGFLPALKRILAAVPKERQTLLFSATFAPEIKALAQQFMRNPREISTAPANTVANTVTHRVHPVDAATKRDLLLHILSQDSRRQTLVFGRTKHGADKLVRHLEQSGIKAAAIHGNKSQNARTRALSDFKTGRVTVLVATDIAARGIDIDQLPVVINFDLPMVAEDYVHRIGRTGRAGSTGEAISLVSHDESGLLRDIGRLLKSELEIANVPASSRARRCASTPVHRARSRVAASSARRARRTVAVVARVVRRATVRHARKAPAVAVQAVARRRIARMRTPRQVPVRTPATTSVVVRVAVRPPTRPDPRDRVAMPSAARPRDPVPSLRPDLRGEHVVFPQPLDLQVALRVDPPSRNPGAASRRPLRSLRGM